VIVHVSALPAGALQLVPVGTVGVPANDRPTGSVSVTVIGAVVATLPALRTAIV
jgi:hypothetical protein